jgi:hypothetical protein
MSDDAVAASTVSGMRCFIWAVTEVVDLSDWYEFLLGDTAGEESFGRV